MDQQIQFARADSGAGAVNVENLDLGRLLEELVDVCAPEAEAQGCRLELQSSGPVRVRGERALLNRAFENVLRNAIRRAPAGTAVEVEVRAQLERATISIRDHGSDVPPEALRGIFKPFYRVAKNGAQSGGGPEIGLASAHRAIELHQGTMTAASTRPGLVMVTELACPSKFPEKPVRADRSAAIPGNR